jgi:hypothetical protein
LMNRPGVPDLPGTRRPSVNVPVLHER